MLVQEKEGRAEAGRRHGNFMTCPKPLLSCLWTNIWLSNSLKQYLPAFQPVWIVTVAVLRTSLTLCYPADTSLIVLGLIGRLASSVAPDAGSYRKLALATIMLATVGVAFALLITAVELSKDEAQPVYDLNLRRGSPEYRLFLAVRASLVSALKCARLPALTSCL